ncbi:hypothetical protein [Nocardia thailandica]|uniref:hypothetical protein n=1 Tax=Nocardia thailandica TaxID=257275 RepID=UPI0012FB75E3
MHDLLLGNDQAFAGVLAAAELGYVEHRELDLHRRLLHQQPATKSGVGLPLRERRSVTQLATTIVGHPEPPPRIYLSALVHRTSASTLAST